VATVSHNTGWNKVKQLTQQLHHTALS